MASLGELDQLPLRSLTREAGVGHLVFTTDGSGVPTVTSAKTTRGVTVAKTATGVYTVTMPGEAYFCVPLGVTSTGIEVAPAHTAGGSTFTLTTDAPAADLLSATVTCIFVYGMSSVT